MCDNCSVSHRLTFRCLPENILFVVRKQKLSEGSTVFRDMFELSPRNVEENGDGHVIDIYESSNDMSLLIRLLQEPNSAYAGKSKTSAGSTGLPIPFPILLRLLDLADKYQLSYYLMNVLHSHLAAYVATEPLLVYGRALQYGLPDIADAASAYLMAVDFNTLTTEQIKVIPTAEAYHKIILLQRHRKTKIKEVLRNSELFPHGYGGCPTHMRSTAAKWEEEREKLHALVEADIAAEMASRLQELSSRCATCNKAISAATDMMAYKASKIARSISTLPKKIQ